MSDQTPIHIHDEDNLLYAFTQPIYYPLLKKELYTFIYRCSLCEKLYINVKNTWVELE